jgi:hypothetical protein
MSKTGHTDVALVFERTTNTWNHTTVLHGMFVEEAVRVSMTDKGHTPLDVMPRIIRTITGSPPLTLLSPRKHLDNPVGLAGVDGLKV